MLGLSSVLYRRIVEVLLPHMETEADRRAVVAPIFSDLPLYHQLDCTGDAYSFTVRLVERLVRYGEIAPGEQALHALLSYVRTLVGIDEQARIALLLHELEGLFAAQTLPTSAQLTGTEYPQASILVGTAEVGSQSNVPVALTSFVGREHEMRQIRALLAKSRLLTLSGPAGCGKTRLACEVARSIITTFVDGVWWIELATLDDAQSLPQAVANVLGVREESKISLLATLLATIGDKQMLLIFDNCEHLIQPCANLVTTLLQAGPHLQILITSRDVLHVDGETPLEILPLALPIQAPMAIAKSYKQFAAIQLFIERAQAVQPDFKLTRENSSQVLQICRQLDGLPLAIELAAARLKLLTVGEIAARLDDRFQLLVGGSRVALPHHRTLRAALNWSYELLNEDERTFFNTVAVFANGFTLSSARAVVCQKDVDEYQVLDWLASLVEKSLIQVEKHAHETARYRILETLRQFGQEKLSASTLDAVVREQYFRYYLALAEEAELALHGTAQSEWLARLRQEHENVCVALSWSVKMARQHAPTDVWSMQALRLIAALCRFWELQGYLEEGRRWTAEILGLSGAEKPTAWRAKALKGAGTLAEEQGDYNAAQQFYQASLTIGQQLQDQAGIAAALNDLGKIATFQGEYTTARSYCEQSLAIRRTLGDAWGIAVQLMNLGNISRYQGSYQEAQSLYLESLKLFQTSGDQWAIAITLNNLGLVNLKQKEYQAARTHLEESLTITRAIEDPQGTAYALQNLGELAYRCGDLETARHLHTQGLELCLTLTDKEGIASSLAYFALLAMGKAEPMRAVQLFAASAALRKRINAPLASDEVSEQREQLADLCTTLGGANYATLWEQGQTLSWQEAVKLARNG